MKSFASFAETEFLEESINTPIEFYMTDDTKLPKEVYGAFEIDGTQYGISLILSKYDKVYMLDMYRIVNVKKRSWSFIKPNHIRSCLSTLVKFMESSYPFLQSKIHGIIIEIPGKTGSEKYVKFLGRILKKSSIKKFQEVPVVKTTDKARNYMFLVKKGIAPTSLFTTATFHKNFEFSNGTAIFDDAIMGQTTDPYKTIKKTVSTTPDKKLAFGAMKVELSADDATIEMLDKASASYKIDKSIDEPATKEEEAEWTANVNTDAPKSILSSSVGGVGFYVDKSSKVLTLSLSHIMAIVLENAYTNVRLSGYDASKFNVENMAYAAKSNYNNFPDQLKKELVDIGMFTSIGSLNVSDENIELLKACVASFMYIDLGNKQAFEQKISELMPDSKLKSTPTTTSSIKEYKLELEKEPTSIVEGFDTANDSSPYSGSMGFEEYPEDITTKKVSVLKMPEVEKWFNNFDPDSYGADQLLVQYTGGLASDANSALRKLVENKDFNFANINDGNLDKKIAKLIKHFKTAPKLESGIWVYRNATTPGVGKYELGDDFIDAAFLSTTLRSTMTLSSGGNLRMKIYLPKGTRCFPMLGKSGHTSEDEIVLPPMSLLRITELYDNIKSQDHRMMVCTSIGSAFEDMITMGKKGVMLEAKSNEKEKEYDPADKWGASTSSYDDAMAMKKLITKNDTSNKK